jgi:hypothetical protein
MLVIYVNSFKHLDIHEVDLVLDRLSRIKLETHAAIRVQVLSGSMDVLLHLSQAETWRSFCKFF